MPTVSTIKMKASQFLQLGEDPPGLRLELVNGEVAVGAGQVPSHSYTLVRLAAVLGNFIDQRQSGELFGDVSIVLDDYNVRRPDLQFFSTGRRHLIGTVAMNGAPDLAVEIASDLSIQVDRTDKLEQYQKFGVTNYWIIDPAERTFEAWTLAGGGYKHAGRGANADVLHLPPFDDLAIHIEQLWRK